MPMLKRHGGGHRPSQKMRNRAMRRERSEEEGVRQQGKRRDNGGLSNVFKSENICKLICAQDANCLWPNRHGSSKGNSSSNSSSSSNLQHAAAATAATALN